MKKFLYLLFSAICLIACSSEDDYSVDENGAADGSKVTYNNKSYTVSRLQTHTEGTGFSIVIMGDGYTQTDINNGVYQTALNNTINTLFADETMNSLKKYFDIYSIEVPSSYSGIDYTKHNTAFKTWLADKSSTQVYGDSVMITSLINSAVGGKTKLKNSLGIVLLNSSNYAGMTLLARSDDVTDSIPNGYGVSYIPDNVTLRNENVFAKVLLHEAVGHGIGKLADEYYYNNEAEESDITQFHTLQKNGFYMNIHYDDELKKSSLYAAGEYYKYPVLVYSHEAEENTVIYPFTQDTRYDYEGLRWIQGGYTFLTVSNLLARMDQQFYFLCNFDFYRPTNTSLMGSITYDNLTFNTPSRLMIYKRVMRAAYGSSWTCDINKSEDYDAFTDFDAPARTAAKTLSSATTTEAKGEKVTANDAPLLAAPKIIQ